MSERVKIILDKNADILRLPAIALRGLVVFPGNIIHFEVGRKKSIAAIEWAMSNNNAVFLTAQQDMDVEDPGFKDLYAYGVVAEVKQVLRVSDELVKVLVEGKYRAKLLTLDSSGRFLLASTKAAALREKNAAAAAQSAGAFTVIAEDDTPDEAVETLIRQRADAKKAKNFAEADRIRDELKARGIEVTDVPNGAKWKRI